MLASSEGIEDLTGGLATFYYSEDIVDLDKFWDEGLAYVNKSFLWGCQTSKLNEQDQRGIYSRHAYAILEAQTIPDGTRLLKVRNPWGKSEWDGDWSDRSKKWTDELKKLLKHEDKDDGIFWISYTDLLRNYPYLHRTRIFDASWTVAQLWTNFTVPLLSSDTYEKTFKFTLSKAATTAIVLSQLDERYFRGLTGQYDFALSFRLHKLSEEEYLYRSHHRYFDDRSISLEVDLEAGIYEVRLKVEGYRHPERPKIEDVVSINWKKSRDKLLQVCRSYDLAHAKVVASEIQLEDEKVDKPAREPTPEGNSTKSNSEANSNEVTASKAEADKAEPNLTDSDDDTEPDTTSEKSVEEGKPSVPDARSRNSLQEKAEEARYESNSDIATTPKADETENSPKVTRAGPPAEVAHQDQKSDTSTTSTDPVIVEKSEGKPEAEAEGENMKAKTNCDASSPKAENPPSNAVTDPESPNIKTDTKPPTQPNDQTKPRKEKTPREDHDKTKTEEDDNPTKTHSEKDEDETKQDLPLPEARPEEEKPKEDDPLPDEPFNSVCTVGLRVYCKDAEARIEMMTPTTALVRDKQFTSSREVRLDVDDPAKS
jgi:Calpain family cysteine protease